ncbi:nuclear transport factor 2 family protein [Labrenzia sp. PHM005]|uniref:nuclear transport factor 2 family protein n=1 Tax=Labrenzia sp. PHM005 TaxID=2590016 RepID=UPI00113FD3C6|nr:nuclear transport factor 2 family protein [Labrenzia sp. PHM005]QDG78318.1 nuclear transport factor 2 family protein [Labrenzia sp. PHM005]
MSASDLCNAYLEALNRSDLDAVQAMFPTDGTVVSPLYGEQNAHEFYARLFSDTSNSKTTLLNVFAKSEDSNSVALHFKYDWTLANGKLVDFECVDVFELTKDRTKFQKLTIIYDTAPLREDFERLKT